MFIKNLIALLTKCFIEKKADARGRAFNFNLVYDARVVQSTSKKNKPYYMVVGSSTRAGGDDVKLFFGFNDDAQECLSDLIKSPFSIGSTVLVETCFDKKEWGKVQIVDVIVIKKGQGSEKLVVWKGKSTTETANNSSDGDKGAPVGTTAGDAYSEQDEQLV